MTDTYPPNSEVKPFGSTFPEQKNKKIDAKQKCELAEVLLNSVLLKIEQLGVSIKVTKRTNNKSGGGIGTNALPLQPESCYYYHPDKC